MGYLRERNFFKFEIVLQITAFLTKINLLTFTMDPLKLTHVCDSDLLGPEDCAACRAEARKRGGVPAVPTSATTSESSINSGAAASAPQFPKKAPFDTEVISHPTEILSPNTHTDESNHLTSSNSIVTSMATVETRRSDSPRSPTSVCWLPEPPLVTDFRRHERFIKTCYSICTYVVSDRKLCGVIVFSTAMHYIHRFIYCHGRPESGRWGSVARVDPATLSAAALFLATKAENYKVKLSIFIEIVFECPPLPSELERHNAYKLMTLQTEVMLLATMSGTLTIIHPFALLTAIAPETSVVGQRANKLYSYTVLTPLSLYFDHHQIAMALVAIVVESVDKEEKGKAHNEDTDNAGKEEDESTAKKFAPRLEKLLPEAKCATELALIEALVVKGKGCGIQKLDAVVEQRLQRKATSKKKASGPRTAIV